MHEMLLRMKSQGALRQRSSGSLSTAKLLFLRLCWTSIMRTGRIKENRDSTFPQSPQFTQTSLPRCIKIAGYECCAGCSWHQFLHHPSVICKVHMRKVPRARDTLFTRSALWPCAEGWMPVRLLSC